MNRWSRVQSSPKPQTDWCIDLMIKNYHQERTSYIEIILNIYIYIYIYINYLNEVTLDYRLYLQTWHCLKKTVQLVSFFKWTEHVALTQEFHFREGQPRGIWFSPAFLGLKLLKSMVVCEPLGPQQIFQPFSKSGDLLGFFSEPICLVSLFLFVFLLVD